jgi:hypothetical protein
MRRWAEYPIWKKNDMTHELGNGPMKYCCRRKEKEENHGQKEEETHEWVWGPYSEEEECVQLSGSEEN